MRSGSPSEQACPRPRQHVERTGTCPAVLAPSRYDPVVRAASEVAGGPGGARVDPARHGWWDAPRVLVVVSVLVLSLGAVRHQHCRSAGWTSPGQFFHACYSDLPSQYASLAQHGVPVESQPVGTAVLMRGMAALVPSGTSPADAAPVRAFFDLGVLASAVALVVVVLAVVGCSGRRPWDAALVAWSPLLVLASLVSLDLVGVALSTAGLWAWAWRRPVLAGALLGLAGTVRGYPLLVLGAVLVLAVRAGHARHGAAAAAAATGAWAAVNLPFLVRDPQAWTGYWASALPGPVGYGSPWKLAQLAGATPSTSVVFLGSLAGLVAVGVGVAVLALRAPVRPRLPAVAVLLLVGALLVLPAFPVQASLWVLPLAVLAVPRWRDHLLWAGAESVYVIVTWLHIASLDAPDRGAPASLYALALALRLAALAWLACVVVAEVRRPETDPVRNPRQLPDPAAPTSAGAPGCPDHALGADDPCGGVLDGSAHGWPPALSTGRS